MLDLAIDWAEDTAESLNSSHAERIPRPEFGLNFI